MISGQVDFSRICDGDGKLICGGSVYACIDARLINAFLRQKLNDLLQYRLVKIGHYQTVKNG
jgi:hypothetical protein